MLYNAEVAQLEKDAVLGCKPSADSTKDTSMHTRTDAQMQDISIQGWRAVPASSALKITMKMRFATSDTVQSCSSKTKHHSAGESHVGYQHQGSNAWQRRVSCPGALFGVHVHAAIENRV